MEIRERKLDILEVSLFIFVLLFFYIKPAFLFRIALVGRIYDVGNYAAFSIVILLVISEIASKSYKPTVIVLLCILLNLVLVISSIINRVSITLSVRQLVQTAACCLLADLCIVKKQRLKAFLNAYTSLAGFYVLINFISIIGYKLFDSYNMYYSSEVIHIYFLGINNTIIRYSIPLIVCLFVYDECIANKTRAISIFYLIVIGLSVFITHSVTGIIGYTLIISIALLYKIIRKFKHSLFYMMFGAAFFLSWLIIIAQTKSKIIGNLLIFFGKDFTYTNRVYIWSNAISLITKSFLIGHGVLLGPALKSIVGNASGAHNYYIDLLFRGGIVAFFVLVLIILISGKKLKNISFKHALPVMIIGVCFSCFVMWTSEAFASEEYALFPFTFVLLYRIEFLCGYITNKLAADAQPLQVIRQKNAIKSKYMAEV